MPSHNHTIRKETYGFLNSSYYNSSGNHWGTTNGNDGGIENTGGGGSHSHGMSGSVSNSSAYNSGASTVVTDSTTPTAFAPKYIDVIICAKD
jgi:hypothetical protein